ncbi:MAG: hypothetical protein RMM53_08350, partial [Bacteroidia bacterium]|nr:hypothetical protein [Bacteroidia bacterium]MDW8334209.1 hypothetical protein [Bacteroidia bacterium]
MFKLVNTAGKILPAIALAASILVVGGCKKDKCEGVTCLNGGSCADGKCNCVNGFSGDRCQIAPTPPTASFTIDKMSCTAPCTFNVTSTSVNATSIEWSVEKVGGGAVYIVINGRTSPNASIEFDAHETGTYKIKLTATNAGGSHTAEKTVTVNESTPTPPTASFNIDKTSCTAPCTFNVTSTSTNATSVEWSVEKVGGGTAYVTINGRFSPNASIEFDVDDVGTYKIMLTATNADGSHTAEKTVTVYDSQPCAIDNTAEITISISGSTNPYKVYIDDDYKGDIDTPGSRTFTFTAGYT